MPPPPPPIEQILGSIASIASENMNLDPVSQPASLPSGSEEREPIAEREEVQRELNLGGEEK